MLNKFLFLLASFALAQSVHAAAVTPHTVLAHANEQQFWIARIDHFATSESTYIDYRVFGQDDRWQRLCRFSTAIDDITAQSSAQGNAAAVLLRDKSWAIIYSDGNIASGGPLPASAQMIALGASPNSWWAIGQTPGGLRAALAAIQPSTQPATAPTTGPSTTAPSTAPATLPSQLLDTKPSLVLYQLAASDWAPIAEIPAPAGETVHVALAIIDQVPYVAINQSTSLSVLHLENGRWITDFTSDKFPQIAAFRFLSDLDIHRLWIQQQTGPDTLIPLNGPSRAALTLNIPTDVPAKDRAVATFGKSIRSLTRSDGKIMEQRFASDTLQPEGKPVELPLPDTAQLIDLQGLHTLVAVVSLMLILLGWFRQQAATEGIQPNLEGLTLAPIGRRFLAGLIDAFPVIFTMAFFAARHAALPSSVPQSRQFLFFVFYWSSGLFYVLHTTLIETYAGRSLGKIMLGLRVVTLQGNTPEPAALVARNVLRIFDLSLFFFPLLFIPFAPLRQRSGDLVAGTTVILDKPRESTTPPDSPPPTD